MKHFKHKQTGEVFAFELDGSQDDLITEDLMPIDSNEAKELSDNKTELAVQAYVESLSYAQKRAYEYPPITDYLDAIVKNDKDQLQAYIDACIAVKEKYPKQ